MDIGRVTLIYFSATGTTRTILERIARGTGADDVNHINLALPGQTPQAPLKGDLVLMGAPVYGGRLPETAVNRFRQLRGDNTLAVPVVLYGNREFEDALLELKNLSIELGFIPVAGGAFIGEHSFSTQYRPIAGGRPDPKDLQTAEAFGNQISERIKSLEAGETIPDLDVPGSYPYEAAGARPMTIAPVTCEDKCTVCGTCKSVCPTSAISVDDNVSTDISGCIRCCACIKSCPAQARTFEDDMMETIAQWLFDNCRARREPELFGVNQ